jgi:hypothetical protein
MYGPICLAAALLGLTAGPAAAAEPVTLRDGVLRYVLGGGERSSAQVSFSDGHYFVNDAGLARAGEGCSDFSGTVQCPHPAGSARVEVTGGDLADFWLMTGLTPATTTLLRAGGGGDQLRLGPGADQADGESGDDTLDGADGNDVLRGGPGDDVLRGGGGGDTLDGGAGRDIADYADASARGTGAPAGPPLRITLNDTLANDGAAGEGDRVTDVEQVNGSESADTIIGGSRGELLQGGGGRDVLRGNGGDDTLSGGDRSQSFVNGKLVYDAPAVRDVLDGGAGDDRFNLDSTGRGAASDVVRCGSGRDTVIGGPSDARGIPEDCERICPEGEGACALVAQFPSGTRSLNAFAGTVRVRLACPDAPIPPCGGSLRITRRGTLLARAGYAILRGRQFVVVAKLTAAGARASSGTVARLEVRGERGARIRYGVRLR